MPARKRTLFSVLAEQRRFVYMVVTLLSVAGIWAALQLPSAIYPELQFSRVTIVTNGSALGARQVLFGITRPIEEVVSVIPGVTRVQSRSIRGGSEINVTFSSSTDMQYALQQVQARVNQVESTLPPGLDVEVERLMPSLFPILSYNLEGGDPPTLYDIAQYQIRPLFSRVPGVGRVDVQASDVREIEIVADPGRLAAQGMTFDDLATAIKTSTTVQAVGRMPADYRQYLIVTTSEAKSADDIANVVVGHGMRVRDLATVTPGTEDHVRIVAGDGRPAALLNITRQIGGNTVAIADSVASIALSLRKTLPSGVTLKPVYDQAALVRDAVKSVRDAMIIGAVLAVIILLLFLRHGRVTAISASSIPLTMAMTVYLMSLLGQTFNLMTLGAMAIAIGLVIDDAVVVTENIVRHLHLNTDRDAAVREAVQELIWPVTTSTITTVVVFLPLGLLTGVEGQFFHALSITLTIAVLVSLLLALTIIPLLAEQYLSVVDAEETTPGQRRGFLARVGGAIDALSDKYERALGASLHHTRWMILAAVLLVIAGVVVHRYVGSGFLPEMDEGAFVLDYYSPGGTALNETDRMVHIAEDTLLKTPEVKGLSRRTGAELGLFATLQNRGDISVRLKDPGERDRSSEEVIDEVRPKIQAAVPRLRIEFVQILSDVINDLAGAARPVEIKLFGADLNQLEAYGTKLGEKVAKVDGVEDLFNGVSEPSAEMSMTIDEAEANRIGLTPDQVSAQVSSALLGVDAGAVRLEDRSVGARVRAPDSVRYNPLLLGSLPIIAATTHTAVPLSALATFQTGESRAELLRENQQQMIDVTADISGRSLGTIMNDVKKVVASNPPPQGIRLELAGQYANQQDAFRALMLVLAIASLSVVAVMVIQFESFVEPLVVLLAAPLSFVGAMVLLFITGTPLNVSSFMGLILLVGLIVKNGIILLDFTRHRMKTEGLTLEPAIREAARIRLRPILMTTLCTLFGLLPLALGLGSGSEMQKPLALAVIGGLALSTPITLFVVPTFLIAIRGRNYRLETAPISPTQPRAV
ncbi:MAG TPA: efflux RND transporter permease subunit [Gemmatimonadaceae bacterium]|jgi:CzcA family heavy metal efflux pump|nr:efflux RND transporter permease subunit [Gemmatimonadaceae bacterium]